MSGIKKARIIIDEQLISAIDGSRGECVPPARSVARRELNRRLSDNDRRRV